MQVQLKRAGEDREKENKAHALSTPLQLKMLHEVIANHVVKFCSHGDEQTVVEASRATSCFYSGKLMLDVCRTLLNERLPMLDAQPECLEDVKGGQ